MDPRRIFGHIFRIETTIAAVVFVLVCAAIVAGMLLSSRRRRRGAEPSRVSERTKLELGYAAAVAAVAAVVVGVSFHARSQEQASPKPATTVDISGFQWCWRFTYPGTSRSVTGTCEGKSIPTMVVPAGQPVTLRITSDDVIHSWWVPALRYKLDAFPNHTNSVTIKVDRTGRWIGRCAEFCGHFHTYMDFRLEAVSPDRYRQWLAGAQA